MSRCLPLILAFLVHSATALEAAEWTFRLEFPASVHDEPFTGRVYVFFSEKRPEPRTGPGWLNPDAFVAKDVVGWEPDTPLDVESGDPALLAFPKPLDEIDLAGQRAQAVVRFEPWERSVGKGTGNGYSRPVPLPTPKDGRATVSLVVDQLVAAEPLDESDGREPFSIRSPSLSKFHGRDVEIRGAVTLPPDYGENPERRYPVIFYVPGFGGTLAREPYLEVDEGDQPFIEVVLDPSCPLGHHVFADSANNGPWGTALVEEWLPAFERHYRTIAAPEARFLTGHSSGGWATLWLQITHPDVFGGTWSTAPDPVDFRDFQRIDLYDPESNVYVDEAGEPRPLARAYGRVLVWYRDFDRMETALGPGGQLHSFEAVFSPRGDDGRPLLAWDRTTGRVNTDVTETWRKYDIRRLLEEEWDERGPELAGKLHVVMGEQDSFYLEGATRLLKESQERLGSDASIEMVPRRDHFNLLTKSLRTRIRDEITARFRESFPDWPRAREE